MKNIHCKMFGHDFRTTRHVTSHIKEYTCKNCQKKLTVNSNGQLTELTPKLKEINDVLEQIHNKRTKANDEQIVFNDLLVFKH